MAQQRQPTEMVGARVFERACACAVSVLPSLRAHQRAGKRAADAAKRDLAGSACAGELMEGWEEYEDADGRAYYWHDETGETRYSPPTGQLDACLAYVRDRVGVPRDMSAYAARWLRATLNWAVDITRSDA